MNFYSVFITLDSTDSMSLNTLESFLLFSTNIASKEFDEDKQFELVTIRGDDVSHRRAPPIINCILENVFSSPSTTFLLPASSKHHLSHLLAIHLSIPHFFNHLFIIFRLTPVNNFSIKSIFFSQVFQCLIIALHQII